MEFIAVVVVHIISGVLSVKISKKKNYTILKAFIIGFLFSLLGVAIVYYSKDKKEEYDKSEDDEFNNLINKIQK